MVTRNDTENYVDEQIKGFPERLREAISSESVRSFSRRSGIPEATIRAYLEGRNAPTLEKLLLLATTADVSIEWLATGNGGRPTKTKQAKPTTLKTIELIESLPEKGQREILSRIEEIHEASKQQERIEELLKAVNELKDKLA